ncbi:MAG: hypothetical protein HN712_22275 [Gemmatimonadetes bacterium]|nr:hypothetical protein [Gemmatimonadota bacterium]
MLDRAEFSYDDHVRFGGQRVHGTISALSNPALAARVGDGDPTTFWEPAAEDFSASRIHTWQLEIDLGRAIWADSIVVSFPPLDGGGDGGDPLKLFVIEASMGESGFDGSQLLYEVIGRIDVPDRSTRRVTLGLNPLGRADFDGDGSPDISGSFVQYVRLTAFKSDFDAAEFLGDGEVGRAIYDALPEERRGLRVYQRRTAGGSETRVDSATFFDVLEPNQRGSIRYYQSELPRIGEIEVWGRGQNLAYQPARRAGASFEDGGRGTPDAMTDGLYSTRWSSQPWQPQYSSNIGGNTGTIGRTVWIDLGVTYWADAVFLGSGTTTEGRNISGYHVLGSDGRAVEPMSLRDETDFAQLEPGLSWLDLTSDIHRDNSNARARFMAEFFPLRKLRFLQLRNVIPQGREAEITGVTGDLAEVQLYGVGYPAEIALISPPFILLAGARVEDAAEVDQTRTLARIYWDAEAVVTRVDPISGSTSDSFEPLAAHPEVDLRLQTRTSDTIDSVFTYYEVTGVGTNAEKRTQVPFETYLKRVADLAAYTAWEAMPESYTVSLQPHMTLRDDDGDGAIDEDPVDGVNNDGDGLVDEDGVSGDRGGPNDLGVVTLLRHSRGRDDDADGLVDEDPIDGRDNDGDGLVDEDGKKPATIRKFPDVTITPVFSGWSPWSPPYRPTNGRSEATIVSPSPRKFLQIRAGVVSGDPDVTIRLTSIAVDLAPPISQQVVAELAILTAQGQSRPLADLHPESSDYAPPVGIEPEANQPYSYFVRAAGPDPNVGGVEDGFNEVVLLAPFPVDISGVRLGTVRMNVANDAVNGLTPTETQFNLALERVPDTNLLRGLAGEMTTQVAIVSSGDSLLLTFPESLNAGLTGLDHALVEIQLTGSTPRAGTLFRSFVRHRSADGAAGDTQRADVRGKDATELVDSQSASPVIEIGSQLISRLRVSKAITPNGDGVNDQAQIQFVLLHLLRPRPVRVDIFDVAGRHVARETSEVSSGEVTLAWDGRGFAGHLVAPGIYVCRVQVETDAATIGSTRLVHVVY